MRDEDLVEDFIRTFGPLFPGPPRDRVVKHLREMLRAARDNERAVQEEEIGEARGRAETRIREVLTRLAPPGTPVTPDLIMSVRSEAAAIVSDELTRAGVAGPTAQLMAGVIAASMKIKEKTK